MKDEWKSEVGDFSLFILHHSSFRISRRPTPTGSSDRREARRRIQSASGGNPAHTRLPPPDRWPGERGPTAHHTCNEGPATVQPCPPRRSHFRRVALDSLRAICLAMGRLSQRGG